MSEELKNIEEISKLLHSEKKNVLIFSHIFPDGDAIGSSLALLEYTTVLGHNANFIIPSEVPKFLRCLPHSDKIIEYSDNTFNNIVDLITKANILIFVDLNEVSRVGSLSIVLEQYLAERQTIVIDHHLNPAKNFNFYYWTTNTSSTAELVFELIGALNDEKLITQTIAQNIFVGIMTDTGSFSYSCHRPETFRVVATLIEKGVDNVYWHNQIYNNLSENQVRLLGFALIERLKIFYDKKSAYIYLSQADLKEFNFKPGDTEGIVNYTLKIEGIYFGVLVTELDNLVKISFRSIGDIDVRNIAHKYFKGGGHKNASGVNFNGTLQKAIEIVENIIKNEIK